MNEALKAALERKGIELPEVGKAFGAYVPARVAGDLILVSGQLPVKDGKMLAEGPVPSRTSLEDAQRAARQCVINGLAAALSVGEPRGVVRVGCFVQSDDGFAEQPKVANAASELLLELFDDSGRHVRAAVGTNALPLNASVEIEFLFHQ